MRKFNVLFLFILVLIIGSAALPVHAASSIGSAAGFSSGCSGLTQAAIPAGAQRIVSGSTTIYIGYRQVSGNNQNSIAARFDSGVLVWCRAEIPMKLVRRTAAAMDFFGMAQMPFMLFLA